MKKTASFVFSLVLSGLSAALAAGPASDLVPATFNEGAVIVTDPAATAELASTLQDAAGAAGSSCQKSEYVVWRQPDQDLEETFNAGVASLGYTYRLLDSSDEAGGRASMFALSSAQQSLAGLWIETGGNAVLAWCTLKAAAAKSAAPALQPTAPALKPAAPVAAPAKPAPTPAPVNPAAPLRHPPKRRGLNPACSAAWCSAPRANHWRERGFLSAAPPSRRASAPILKL